jgi:hypothetical protein
MLRRALDDVAARAGAPRLFCSDTDRDGDVDGVLPDHPQLVAEAWEAWQRRRPMSLREVLVGMIEEYARHMGHVDLLRERIDGRIGQ